MSDNVEQQDSGSMMSDEEILRYTQALRKKVVQELTSNETEIPKDAKDQRVLLDTLDGMDRAALAVKKIESKERSSSADREAMLMIEALSRQMKGVNMFRIDVPAGAPAPSAPVIRADLPPIEIGIGETEVGITQETSQEFIDRYEAEHPRKT